MCLVLLRMGVGASLGGDAFTAAVCSPTQRINCDYVLSSPWAKIGPLPAAAVGLAYFAALAVWYAAVGLPNAAGRRWRLAPLLLTLVGLVVSVYYVYVMAVHLPVWCTWCAAAHGVNAALFVTTFLARPAALPEGVTDVGPHPTAARAFGVMGACVGAALVMVTAVFGYQMQMTARQFQLALLDATNNPEYVLWRWQGEPLQEIALREDELVIGPAGAPHTLVVYTDFECEKCGWFHTYADRLLKMFPDHLRIVWRHYPVSPQCNEHVEQAFHYFACDAALAAEAARRIGEPAEAVHYHGLLYHHASRFASRPYKSLAAEAGLDASRFAREMESDEVRLRVAQDIDSAAKLGVISTPALFLNGRRLPTWHILTDEPRPRIDVGATDELWRRLLRSSTPSISSTSSTRRSLHADGG